MKNRRIIYWLIGSLIVIILFANKQKLFKAILPPKPEFVSFTVDDSSTKLFDYSVVAKGAINNKGGDGFIVVEITVTQGSKEWTKIENLEMQSHETKKFEIIFDEVQLTNDSITSRVIAYPLGANR